MNHRPYSPRWLRIFCQALMALACPFQVFALDPGTRVSQFRVDGWRSQDGLPSSAVYAAAQTDDGYLWLGTEEGLARFDGHQFTVFNKRNSPAFRQDYVRALCTGPNGDLWIGTLDGLLRLADRRFERFELSGLSKAPQVLSLDCLSDEVWIGLGSGLAVFKEGKVRATSSWTSRHAVTALAHTNAGRIIVGTFGDGLFSCSSASCQRRIDSDRLPSDKVTALLVDDEDSEVVVGTYDGGVTKLVGHEVQEISPALSSIRTPVWDISRDSDSSLWFALGDGGLGRLQRGELKVRTAKDQHPEFSAFGLFEDKERNLWVTSINSGLRRVSDVKVQTFGVPEGLSQDLVWSVMEDSHSNLWVGTSGSGVNKLREDSVIARRIPDNPLANNVTAMAETLDGSVWLGTRAGLARIVDGGTPELVTSPEAPEGFVPALFVDSIGRLWAGSFSSAPAVLESGKWHRLDESSGYPARNAWSFAEGHDGSIWVATSSYGLLRFLEGQWTSLSVEQGLASTSVLAVFVDSTGGTWAMAQGAGVQRIMNGRAVELGARTGMATDAVYSMLEDNQGSFWFGTSRGVYRIAKDELEAAAHNPARFARAELFDTSDGMRSAECNGTAQPVAWRKRDGTLWFGTSDGVVRIDPAHIRRNDVAPHVMIEDLSVDGRIISSEERSTLPSDTKRIVIRFAATSLTAPEKMRYRYRLNGLDDEWASFDGRREVEFTGLRPGQYLFSLLASNSDGVWAQQAAELAFQIERPFIGSPEFYLLVALGALILGVVYHRYRLALLRARSALLLERSHIARELHDTIAQGFSSILVQLEVGQRMVPDSAAGVRQRLKEIQAIARENMEDLRRTVYMLRSESPLGRKLTMIIEDEATKQLAGTDLALSLVEEGEPKGVAPLVAHHLCRIVQQAISNALLHSSASQLEIRVSFGADSLKVVVSDDGRGTLPGSEGARALTGSGIEGMRSRAQEVGGTVEVLATAIGVEVRVSMPYRVQQKRKVNAE